LYSFSSTFAYIWSSWDMDYMGLSLSGDFNSNKLMRFNSFYLFITLSLSFKTSTLKSPKMMIGQCYGRCWIIFWRLFKNVNIKHEWAFYTHTMCIDFHVLVLKVATMYYNHH
jgi:hypothetical protein